MASGKPSRGSLHVKDARHDMRSLRITGFDAGDGLHVDEAMGKLLG